MVMRKHRNGQPKKLFKASDLCLLVSNASPQLAAMILLGINVGFGNADCGNLTIEKLDLVEGWHTFGRPKTGIENVLGSGLRPLQHSMQSLGSVTAVWYS